MIEIHSSLHSPFEYVFYGMQRSGHHAILYWAQKMCAFPMHINDVRREVPILKTNPQTLIQRLVEILATGKVAYNRENFRFQPIPSEEIRLKRIEQQLKREKPLQSKPQHFKEKPHLNTTIYNTYTLRDPLNCFSSRLKHSNPWTSFKGDSQKNLLLWKNNALFFKEPKSFVPLPAKKHIFVNYNSWVKDIDYRKEIASQFEKPFDDTNFSFVPKEGGGSSFQGRIPQASRLAVFERWREGLQMENYLDCFDEEIFALTKDLFPGLEGFEEVYRAWKTK